MECHRHGTIWLSSVVVPRTSAAWKFTMKAIKWAGAGASLLDPVSAHLITPKYEHELPPGNGKREYFEAGLRGAKRQCCCVPVLLSASGACPATTGTECRPRVQQRPKWNVDRLLSTDRSGSVDCRRHGAILAFIRGGAARSAA